MEGGGHADLKAYHEALWAKTNPAADHTPKRIAQHGKQSVVCLLPSIQLCRRLMVEVTGCYIDTVLFSPFSRKHCYLLHI